MPVNVNELAYYCSYRERQGGNQCIFSFKRTLDSYVEHAQRQRIVKTFLHAFGNTLFKQQP